MKLKEWMEINKVSSNRLALKANVEVSSITRYLNGERGISYGTAARLSAATLGSVSISEMMAPAGLPKGAKK